MKRKSEIIMVHKTIQQSSPFFEVGEKGQQRAVKSIPCVVYAPKYDEKLREEFEVEVTDEGTYRITTTRIGKRGVSDFVAEVDSYDQARDVMFEKFNQSFNRPSELA